jgi:glycosyltransferase involved in cell wall biosynthesis
LLLVVDQFSVPPLIGTAVIAYHWARLLRERGHEVELLCTDQEPDPGWGEFFRATGARPAPIPIRRRPRWRMALGLLHGEPPALLRVDAEGVARGVAGTAARGGTVVSAPADLRPRYDAAVVIGPSLLRVAEALRRQLRVVFVPVDAVSLVLGTRLEVGGHDGPAEGVRWRVEHRYWRRLEERDFPGFEAVVFVAPADAEVATRGWPEGDRRRVHVIPNGVDTRYFAPGGWGGGLAGNGSIDGEHGVAGAGRAGDDDGAELIFTGNLWTPDSVDAALWFIAEVLPLVRAARPEARLRLVGRSPHPVLLEAAARDPLIRVHGDVPDLRPYLKAATVYLCPLRTGAGVKNRLLEGLAMGKAAVSTRSCADALGLADGEHLLAADEPGEFAAAVLRLLGDEGLRARLGEAGRGAVAERFSWEAGVARLEEVLGETNAR